MRYTAAEFIPMLPGSVSGFDAEVLVEPGEGQGALDLSSWRMDYERAALALGEPVAPDQDRQPDRVDERDQVHVDAYPSRLRG
jgi:hypothetical protein